MVVVVVVIVAVVVVVGGGGSGSRAEDVVGVVVVIVVVAKRVVVVVGGGTVHWGPIAFWLPPPPARNHTPRHPSHPRPPTPRPAVCVGRGGQIRVALCARGNQSEGSQVDILWQNA